MKITRYVHSCLVVEDQGRTAVFDPGVFSVGSGLLESGKLTKLDDIIITHEHPDHLHVPLLQALVKQFPAARIFTNDSMAVKLQVLGYPNVSTQSQAGVDLFPAAHEPNEPMGVTPANVGVHYLSRLTNPGDSHHIAESKEILALPITAPWGTLMRAVAMALELKPKFILPVHDWHWNIAARQQTYERCEAFFGGLGIKFIKLVDGETVEL